MNANAVKKRKEEPVISVFDKYGNFMSKCTPKRAQQLLSRGNAIQVNDKEIMLLILRDDHRKIRQHVYERDSYQCYYCGCTCEEGNISLDHLNPRSRGGSDLPENLVTSCIACNEEKKNMTVEEYYLLIASRIIWTQISLLTIERR